MANDIFKTAREEDLFSDISDEQKQFIDIASSVAMIIRDKRAEMGMSQLEFAKHMNCSQTTISTWENGTNNFSLETICRIFAKLGIKAELRINPEQKSVSSSSTTLADRFRGAGSGSYKYSTVYSSPEK